MQVFFENLYENGISEGLKFKNGSVKRISEKFDEIKVPNIGWGKVNFNDDRITNYLGKYNNFYFCHSYFVDTTDDTYLAFLKGSKLPAATLKNNILGVQFHPENSSLSGELFLKWFVEEFNDFQ